ncbi:MAG: BON domain-containing protein [Planctomycetia bacterium]
MSILRSAFVMAVVGASFVLPAARADDLAGAVAAKLRESGALAGYRVNVKAKSGTVWLEGRVADQNQLAAAVSLAENTPGVERVVNRLAIGKQAEAAGGTAGLGMPASAWSLVGAPKPATAVKESPVQLTQALTPAGQAQGGAVGRPPQSLPRPLAMSPARAIQSAGQQRQPTQGGDPRMDPRAAVRGPVQRTAMRKGMKGDPMHPPSPGGYEGPVVDGQMVPGTMRVVEGGPIESADGGYAAGGQPGPGGYAGGGPGYAGGPMPMGGTGVGMPPIPGRGDGPNVPNYAWPSYSSSPNIASVQYPTQYSPTAWPYIGPFYPYPQVPLGWRRVSLEWDDGWWWLDFDERHIHSHHR